MQLLFTLQVPLSHSMCMCHLVPCACVTLCHVLAVYTLMTSHNYTCMICLCACHDYISKDGLMEINVTSSMKHLSHKWKCPFLYWIQHAGCMPLPHCTISKNVPLQAQGLALVQWLPHFHSFLKLRTVTDIAFSKQFKPGGVRNYQLRTCIPIVE